MTKKSYEKVATSEEIEALVIQNQKDSALQSLLYLTRKLGEVDGIISMQADPDESLVKVQKDFTRVCEKLVETVGIEQYPEISGTGIGGDQA